MNTNPELVIQSLLRQLSDYAVKVALLEATLAQQVAQSDVDPTTEENIG